MSVTETKQQKGPKEASTTQGIDVGKTVPVSTASRPEQLFSKEFLVKRKVSLFFVYLCVFIDMLGVSIVVPILPFYAIKLGSNSFEVGLMFSVYAAAQMVASVYMGRLSDLFGRRPTLLLSLIGSAVGFLCQGLSTTTLMLILARAVSGLFGGSPPIAQAYVADVTTKEERPQYLALSGVTIALSFLFGPAIGSGLSQFSLETPLFLSAALSFCAFLLAIKYLPEAKELAVVVIAAEKDLQNQAQMDLSKIQTRTEHSHGIGITQDDVGIAVVGGDGAATDKDKDKSKNNDNNDKGKSKNNDNNGNKDKDKSKDKSKNNDNNDKGKRKDNDNNDNKDKDKSKDNDNNDKNQSKPSAQAMQLIVVVCVASYFSSFAFAAFQTMFALYTQREFGLSSLDMGFIFSAMSVIFMVNQSMVFNRLRLRVGLLPTLAIGGVLLIIAFACMPLPNNIWVVLVFVFVQSFGVSLIMPGIPSILSTFATPSMQGTIMGYGQLADSFSRVSAPVIYGVLFEQDTRLPFFIAAVAAGLFVILVLVILYIHQDPIGKAPRKHPSASHQQLTSPQGSIQRPEDFLQATNFYDEDEEQLPLLDDKDTKLASDLGVWMGRILHHRNYSQWTSHIPATKRVVSLSFPPLSDNHSLDEILMVLNRSADTGRQYNEWQQQRMHVPI